MLAGAAMMNVGVDKVSSHMQISYMYKCLFFIFHLLTSQLIPVHNIYLYSCIFPILLSFRQMAGENKNLQSIANESEKRADVEKTGLLEEADYDE